MARERACWALDRAGKLEHPDTDFAFFLSRSRSPPSLALRREESRPQSGHVRSFRDPGAVLTFWLARRKNKSARVPGKGEGGKDEGGSREQHPFKIG